MRKGWNRTACGGLWILLLFNTVLLAANEERPATLLLTDHPLVDRIWAVSDGRFIEQQVLLDRLIDADYIVLGETHDNRSHHNHQAWVINQLAGQRRTVNVAFEMIDARQGKAIAGKRFASADELIAALNHFKSGWQYQLYYQPLFASVLQAGMAILPANVDRHTLMTIIMRGDAQPAAELDRLLHGSPLTRQQEIDMEEEIIESHCHMLKRDRTAGMVRGQRLRDAAMALSLLNSHSGQTILIAGSGHARRDRGVPLYLLNEKPSATVLSIGMLEVEEGATSVDDYAEQWGGDVLPFDIVWFTPQAERTDPCLELQ